MRTGRGRYRLGVILGTGEHPLAEAWKRACHRRDSDVAENFPPFHALPAHWPSLTETTF